MLVIYMGPAPSIRFADTGQVVERWGDPIERPDGAALVARGDFIEFEPEPVRRPVEKQRPAAKRGK